MAVSLTADARELTRSIGPLAERDPAAGTQAGLARALCATHRLLAADHAALLVTDLDGHLRWATNSPPPDHTRAAWQADLRHGPAAVALRTGRPVAAEDLAADSWPPACTPLMAAGIRAALSVPVALAGSVVGVLALYRHVAGAWDGAQVATAQTGAELLGLLLGAVVGATAARELAGQLQHALTSRVQIEQAKGVLMARNDWDEHAAWEWLRASARSSRRTVVAVARELLADTGRSA